MKLLTSTLAVAAGLHLISASDPRDQSGDVWKSLSSSSSLSKRQTTWSPPSNLVKPLQEVWDHEAATYNNGNLLGFKNYGYDILMASNGTINFCVRWDSTATLSAAQRTAITNALKTNVLKWTDNLTGFMGWPFSTIPVKVTGWATKDKSLLLNPTTSETIHTTIDTEGIAECDPRCGRFFHQDGNYGACPGGAEGRYDMSLWLTSGMEGGAGGDWGQRVGSEYFLGALESPHIWLHEFGHTMGLDDFYDWTPTGITNFIMLAGSSMVVTDFDIWMMRDFWRNLASRYNLAAATTPKASSSALVATKQTSSALAKPTSTTLKVTVPAASSASTSVKDVASSAKPTTTLVAVKSSSKVAAVVPTTTSASTIRSAAKYSQCGGEGWKGATACVAGSTCVVQNQWYSQCL